MPLLMMLMMMMTTLGHVERRASDADVSHVPALHYH